MSDVNHIAARLFGRNDEGDMPERVSSRVVVCEKEEKREREISVSHAYTHTYRRIYRELAV